MEILCRTVVLRQAQNEVYLCFSLSLETPHLRCRPGARWRVVPDARREWQSCRWAFTPRPSPLPGASEYGSRCSAVVGAIWTNLGFADWAWRPPKIGLPASSGGARHSPRSGSAAGLDARPKEKCARAKDGEQAIETGNARHGFPARPRWVLSGGPCRDYRPGAPIENSAKG